MSKIYITAMRLNSGGTRVKHITDVWYGANSTYTTADNRVTTAEMAGSIEAGGYNAWVKDPLTLMEASVLVVSTPFGSKYLRTKADDDLNDNLLSLPQK